MRITIKVLREEKGIKKKFLSETLGISRGRWDRIEDGESDMPAKFIPLLSKVFGVSELELLKICKEECKHGRKRIDKNFRGDN